MNNRARQIQYRKSTYRKRRTKAIVIISLISLAVLFVLFLIIGTALHNKTERSESKRNNRNESNATDTVKDKLSEPRQIGAYALPLLADGSTFSERLSALPNDASSVCVALNSTDGTLLCRSSLSSTLSYLTSAPDSAELSSLLARIDDSDLYTSALLYIPSFAEQNELLRDVYLTSWCSLAVEAIRAGAGDCLLIARSASAENVEKICYLADLIREIEPDAIIGFAIPEDVIAAEDSETLISKLAESFNYLALDATNYKDGENVETYVESKISQMQMQIIYYKMRVILPYSADAEQQQKYIDVAKKYNVTSWQIKP